jgi:hypothetical protein
MSYSNKSKMAVIKSLVISQLLLAFLEGNHFNILGFLLGQILTAAYCILFPFLAIFEPIRLYSEISVSILPSIHSCLYSIGKFSFNFPLLHTPLLLFLFLIFTNKKLKVLTCLLFSFDCTNQSELKGRQPLHYLNNSFLKYKKIKNTVRTDKKVFIQTTANEHCRAKLKNYYWELSCKDLRRNAEP